MDLTNQKILVTGADGFIGSHLDLCCHPWRAVVFDEGGCHLPSVFCDASFAVDFRSYRLLLTVY